MHTLATPTRRFVDRATTSPDMCVELSTVGPTMQSGDLIDIGRDASGAVHISVGRLYVKREEDGALEGGERGFDSGAWLVMPRYGLVVAMGNRRGRV